MSTGPSSRATTGVLFVCLGNICRSPMAKFIFADLAARRGAADRLRIDSCGTSSYHAGDGADPRTLAVARLHGLDAPHTARPLRPALDFVEFEYLLAMDAQNKASLLQAGAPPERVFMMRSFDPALAGRPDHELDVPDPYYGGPNGFDEMHRMLLSACGGLLDAIERRG